MKPLTENTHPSHDFHPDDDVIACDVCGCRTYSDEAKHPCQEVRCPRWLVGLRCELVVGHAGIHEGDWVVSTRSLWPGHEKGQSDERR